MKKAFTIIQFICIVAITFIVVVIVSPAFVHFNHAAGEGSKVGNIVKVSKVGWFKDTYEAQIIRGGMNNGSGAFGVQPFDFTIEDQNLVKTCEGYMRSNVEVILTYKSPKAYWRLFSDSGHFAVSVKPVKE